MQHLNYQVFILIEELSLCHSLPSIKGKNGQNQNVLTGFIEAER
jgi:hypothetical protein